MFNALTVLNVACPYLFTYCAGRESEDRIGGLNVIRGAALRMETGKCSWLCDSFFFFSPDSPVMKQKNMKQRQTYTHNSLCLT